MKRTQLLLSVALVLLGLAQGEESLRAGDQDAGAMLPADTLAVLTIPNVPAAKAAFWGDPLIRLFADPSMKKYADKISTAWESQAVPALEKEFGIKLSEYTELMNGQLTVGVFMGAPQRGGMPSVNLLLALDAGDREEQLRTKLKDVRQRLSDAGQALKPITIRNQNFYRMNAGQVLGQGAGNGSGGGSSELFWGQVDSLLMISSSAAVLERSLAASSGATVSSLADNAGFSRLFANRFKSSYGFGWVNFSEVYKLIEAQVEILDRQFAKNANPLIPKPSAILAALGLDGLEALSFNLKELESGSMVELAMTIPQQKRRGVFELLALEKKDSLPLNRVPSDVVKFNRTRIDLAKSWQQLEGMVGQLAPPLTGLVELFLGGLGKDRDPNFDFRESFFGNLGDDIITIGMPPRSAKLEDLATAPSLTLLGSPNPDQLAQALVVATGLIPSGGNVLTEREFLGRKIFSFTIPGMVLPGTGGPGQEATPAGFYMAADDAYLVFSGDERALEDYLRGPSSSQEPLRRMAGLRQATQVLADEPLTSFRYDNAVEIVKGFWEMGRENPDLLTGNLGLLAGAAPNPLENIEGMADLSELPPFERVAKYFHYTLGGSSSDANYLNYRWYRPTPPQLK